MGIWSNEKRPRRERERERVCEDLKAGKEGDAIQEMFLRNPRNTQGWLCERLFFFGKLFQGKVKMSQKLAYSNLAFHLLLLLDVPMLTMREGLSACVCDRPHCLFQLIATTKTTQTQTPPHPPFRNV